MGSIYKPTLKSGAESGLLWISYYSNGKRIRESAGTADRKAAETLLKEREGRVATGQPILPRGDRIRYEEARDDLLTFYRVHGTRDIVEAQGRLAHLDPCSSISRLGRSAWTQARRKTARAGWRT